MKKESKNLSCVGRNNCTFTDLTDDLIMEIFKCLRVKELVTLQFVHRFFNNLNLIQSFVHKIWITKYAHCLANRGKSLCERIDYRHIYHFEQMTPQIRRGTIREIYNSTEGYHRDENSCCFLQVIGLKQTNDDYFKLKLSDGEVYTRVLVKNDHCFHKYGKPYNGFKENAVKVGSIILIIEYKKLKIPIERCYNILLQFGVVGCCYYTIGKPKSIETKLSITQYYD